MTIIIHLVVVVWCWFISSITFVTTSLVGATTTTLLGCTTTNANQSYHSLSNSVQQQPPAYTEWLSQFGTQNYDHSKYFGTNNNIALHWNITNSARLYIAVAVLMNNRDTTMSSSNTRGNGWVGFGLSEAGGMAGADMVLFTVSTQPQTTTTTKTTHLVDAYCEDYTTPIVDKCQDWILHQSFLCDDGGDTPLIIFEASRPLDTGDSQDISVSYDGDISFSATKVIFAYGNTAKVSYHSPNHVTKGVVRFFGEEDLIRHDSDKSTSTAKQYPEEYKSMELTAGNISVPLNETTYAKFCFASTDFLEEMSSEVHVIAMQYIYDERSRGFVHHLILYGKDNIQFIVLFF